MARLSMPPQAKPAAPNTVQDFVTTSKGEIMVVVHTSSPPSDAEWTAYLEGVGSSDLQTLRSVVFTDGGAPNSAQRKSLNDVLEGRQVPGIVISPSALVRGVVTALAWFNPGIKVYSPEQFDDAVTYLELSPAEIETVWETLDKLRAQLDDPTLRAIPKRKR